MSLPVKPMVFILLVTQSTHDGTHVGVGAVFFNRIDAHAAMRKYPYDSPDVKVVMLEREVRGELPVPSKLEERANSPEWQRPG